MAGQVVQITINVTDANASEAVEQIVTQLNALGPAGQAAGAEAGAGLDQVGKHAITSREQVRLLSQEMGLRVPRAMQSVIANSQAMSAAIGAIAPAMIAIGGVDILVHMAQEAYNLYEKYIDINAAQTDFLKNLNEAKDKDFVNVHSIETARLRIDEAASSMVNLRDASREFSSEGWLNILQGMTNPNAFAVGVGEVAGAHKLAGESAKAAGQTQELSPQVQNLQHQQNLAEIEEQHAGDAKLRGEAKISAELEKQLALHREMQRYTAIEEGERGNPRAHDAGKSLEAIQDAGARAKAKADEIELRRQETSQVIQMQNEAMDAGLAGNALRAAQEQQAIEAITRKFLEGEINKRTAAGETAAVQQKFAAEALKLQEPLDEQTKHMADEAAQAGLKGIPLIEAQLKTQMGAINAAEQNAVGRGGVEIPAQSADYASQRVSAQRISDQKIVESHQRFTEQIRALNESANDSEVTGYARIEADTRKHLETLAKDYEAQYGEDRSAWAGYQEEKKQIQTAADREMLQLHQRTMSEISKEEEQAARYTLSPWEQAALKIQDDWADKVRAINADEDQQRAHVQGNIDAVVMIEQEADAKRVAAHQLMVAQMTQAEEEMRKELANGLQSLFSHPEQFFEKRAMDTAFQLMANEMLSAFKSSTPAGGILQYLFGMGPQMSTSTNPVDAMSSALGFGSHGTAGLSSTSAINPTMVQFQQGSSTLLTAGQMLVSAASSLQSAAGTIGASGGLGIGSGASSGLSLPGFAGAGSSASSGGGGSFDLSSLSDSNAMMLPGVSSTSSSLISAGSWNNSMMLPGVSAMAGEPTSLLGTSVPGSAGATASGASGLSAAANIGAGVMLGAGTLYSAYQDSNPVAGGVGGLESGAMIGGAIGGPAGMVVGAIIGGIAGVVAGLLGDKGRSEAESLDVNTIQPELAKDVQDYEAGRSGYETLAPALNSMLISAQNETQQMGSGARAYFSNNIQPEINAVLASLQKQERGGRSAVTLSAAQYHEGGWTGDFGDLATSDTEGFIHAMQNEFVVNPIAAAAHAPILQAMNSGTNFAYSNSVQPRMPAGSAGGGNMQLTIQALDSKSVAQWAKAGGGLALMAALNQAQRQYSGVGRG